MHTSTDSSLQKILAPGPEVSVVILNWNGIHFLEKFLPGICHSTYPNKRIIVADNASTDNSIEYLETYFPQVEIILNTKNEGFAKGYNTALSQVKSGIYVLLNSDVEVTPGWIEPIVTLMQADESIAACQPKILAYHNKTSFEYAGACGGWIDTFGYPFARGRVFDYCEEDKGQYDKAAPCFWATGAALFIRADLYHKCGGLDEFFFAHQEEIDLCWRLQLQGYRVYCEPASVVYHVGGGSLHKSDSRKTFLNFRNNLIMMFKNMLTLEKCWKFPARFVLDMIASVKNLLSGSPSHAWAICKAWLHFTNWIIFHQKKSAFSPRKFVAKNGLYEKLVLWDYYIKGKKRFSEIIGGK